MSKKNKALQFEKFLVCPNCKRPLYRKSALKIKGLGGTDNYCGHCGVNLQVILKKTPAGKTKKNDK